MILYFSKAFVNSAEIFIEKSNVCGHTLSMYAIQLKQNLIQLYGLICEATVKKTLF